LTISNNSVTASVYVTIFENKAEANLVSYVVPAALETGLSQSSLTDLFTTRAARRASALEAVPGITPGILGAVSVAMQLAHSKTFQVVYLVSIAFGACAIIAALVIDPSKMADKMTTDIAQKFQGVGRKEESDLEETME
jgi:heme A synthase